MQHIPALRVALKDRPKVFQYIICFLVCFSLMSTVFNAVLLIQKQIYKEQSLRYFYGSQHPKDSQLSVGNYIK